MNKCRQGKLSIHIYTRVILGEDASFLNDQTLFLFANLKFTGKWNFIEKINILAWSHFIRPHGKYTSENQKKEVKVHFSMFRKWKSFLYDINAMHSQNAFREPRVQGSPRPQPSQDSSSLISPWPSYSLCWRPWCCAAMALLDLWAVTCLTTLSRWAGRPWCFWTRWGGSPLSCVSRTEETSSSRGRWWTAASSRRTRPCLSCTRCCSRSSTSSTQRAPLLPGTTPSWRNCTLHFISSCKAWRPAWYRPWERKTLSWRLTAQRWCWRGTSRESVSTWTRRNTVAVPGNSSEWRSGEPSPQQQTCRKA